MAAETAIKDLRPGMKNVTCVVIVIDRGSTRQVKDGSIIRQCRVADKTGSIYFSLWNEQANAVESGDILRLVRGYVSLWKGAMILYSGKYGQLEKIGEFTMVFSNLPDMSDPNPEFLQQQQKEKESLDGRSGHHENRNGVSHTSHSGEVHNGSGQKSSGRLGLGHRGESRRSYTLSPTREHRPSPPHTHTPSYSHPSQQSPSLTTNSHSALGGPHGDNYHTQNLGPHRTHGSRQDIRGSRYQPFPVRR